MNYFEVYCEKENGLSFSDDNFSFIVRASKKPTIKAITRKFKRKIGKYFVNAIWLCDNANNNMNYCEQVALDFRG